MDSRHVNDRQGMDVRNIKDFSTNRILSNRNVGKKEAKVKYES